MASVEELEGRIEGLGRALGIISVLLCREGLLCKPNTVDVLRDCAASLPQADAMLASAAGAMRDVANMLERAR